MTEKRKKLVFGIVFSFLFCFLCVGYAQINDELFINGSVTSGVQDDVFIYEVLDSPNGNQVDNCTYSQTLLNIELNFNQSKELVYYVNIINKNDIYNYYFYEVLGKDADASLGVDNDKVDVKVEQVDQYDVIYKETNDNEQSNNRHYMKVTFSLKDDDTTKIMTTIWNFRYIKRRAELAPRDTWFNFDNSDHLKGLGIPYDSPDPNVRGDITGIEIKSTTDQVKITNEKKVTVQDEDGNIKETINVDKAWYPAEAQDDHNDLPNLVAYIKNNKITIIGGDELGNIFSDNLNGFFSHLTWKDTYWAVLNSGADDNNNNYFYKVTEINGLENIKTMNATNLEGMFWRCNNLQSVNISTLQTSKVTSMVGMFAYCGKLTTLDLHTFDTSQVTSFSSMFYNCEELTQIEGLTNFDTSKAVSFGPMFLGCKKLTTLDLSSFDTSNIKTMTAMFSTCNSLKTIYVSERWNSSNLQSLMAAYTTSSNKNSHTHRWIFYDCDLLKGAQGSSPEGSIDISFVNINFAKIDGGTSNPGYFTYKATPSS